MKTLPAEARLDRSTREFDQGSIPSGLLSAHSTKAGVWGRIVVAEGRLRYRILEPAAEEHVLDAERPGVIEPGVLHEVEPIGTVRFRVEFWRCEG